MWDNSSGHKGLGACMCTLMLIRDNRVEVRGKGVVQGGRSPCSLTGVVDPLGQARVTPSLLEMGGGERKKGTVGAE